MLEKSKKRALRRWRSWCVWMRRLRGDWNSHGWKRDPIGPYLSGQRDGTRLCNCFFLDHKEALRFKNTPNRDSFSRKDRSKYREFGDPFQERRLDPPSRSPHHSGGYPRNRRVHFVNQSCGTCGAFIERVRADARSYVARCRSCELQSKVLNG